MSRRSFITGPPTSAAPPLASIGRFRGEVIIFTSGKRCKLRTPYCPNPTPDLAGRLSVKKCLIFSMKSGGDELMEDRVLASAECSFVSDFWQRVAISVGKFRQSYLR